MANETIYPYGTNGQLPSSIGVINDLTTGGADKALSAEMGKTLLKAIARLLNALSPTAFTGEKPTDADLDIYAPKFTITLPTDTRVDMTNQNAQVEAGDSYTNTFSLNETAEEGYVLRLSATMEGGGTITADATTGVVSTSNVTGNITITASAGVAPMKIHSYDRSYIEGSAEEPPRHFADQVGNFDLYLQADVSYNTNYYQSGYYANGTTGRTGYGSNRDIGIDDFADFTIVLKDVSLYDSGQISTYDKQQAIAKFYDRNTVNTGANGSQYGQFQIQLASNNDADSYTNNSTGSMRPHITYMSETSGTVRMRFNDDGSTGIVPASKGTHTFHIVMSYNSAAGTATAWVVDSDSSNNTVTLKLSGTLLVGKLRIPCIAIKDRTDMPALDVYNYAMTEQQVATEFNATIP